MRLLFFILMVAALVQLCAGQEDPAAVDEQAKEAMLRVITRFDLSPSEQSKSAVKPGVSHESVSGPKEYFSSGTTIAVVVILIIGTVALTSRYLRTPTRPSIAAGAHGSPSESAVVADELSETLAKLRSNGAAGVPAELHAHLVKKLSDWGIVLHSDCMTQRQLLAATRAKPELNMVIRAVGQAAEQESFRHQPVSAHHCEILITQVRSVSWVAE